MMSKAMSLSHVQDAVAGTAAAFRARAVLQPAGGEGDKVFPPTYAGASYATESRRVTGRSEPVECVLLDSVQAQANRMEEALQRAVDEGVVKLPLIEVDFDPYYPGDDQPDNMRLLDPIGRISSLQAPHRIADAILRDSFLDGQPFRKTDVGRAVDRVSLRDATPLLELCPTALLFGMWDSTGPKGGLGAKFERAMVSEIIGIDAVYGVKSSSRLDPLGIQRNAGPLYANANGKEIHWTLDESKAKKEKNKAVTLGKDGRPSEANHGNVTPSLSDWDRQKDRYLAGGVTISSAEQTIVISLPALRRLRFPVNGEYSAERDIAGRTLLAALGLLAAALADQAGLDLRSRCLLYPEDDLNWDVLDRKNPGKYVLPVDNAIAIFEQAVIKAKDAGLPSREDSLVLTPSDPLVKLVVKSQRLAMEQGGDQSGGDE